MAKQGSERELPATAFAVLGLLSFGQASGYDLAKSAEQSIGNFFSPAKSHIYSELRRLVEVGYATEKHVPQETRPDKRLYKITAKGTQALRDWVARPEAEPEQIKSTFLLRLFFSGLIEPEVVIARMKEYRRNCEENLDRLRAIEKEIVGVPEVRYPYYTLRAGLAYTRAGMRWADEIIKEMEAAR